VKPGKKPNAIPSVRWTLYLPRTLAAEVQLLLLDPMKDRIRYSARNDLMERLLQEWVALRRKTAGGTVVPRITQLDRLISQIEFELSHFDSTETPRQLRKLIDEAKKPNRELQSQGDNHAQEVPQETSNH
jgi:hypothetical protein